MSDAKWSKRNQLWLRVYPEEPVFHDEFLADLHAVLVDHLPTWTTRLKVAENSDSKRVFPVRGEENLNRSVKLAAPNQSGLGSAVLRGAYKGLTIYLDSCEETLPPELNFISVVINRLSVVEGREPSEWAWKFFKGVVASLPVRYGNVRLAEEFDAKNLIDDAEGVRAVGVKLTISLPGLYWLNYFGRPYVRLIGESRLLSAPAFNVEQVGNGVLVALDSTPLTWRTNSYKKREEDTIAYLGSDLFFSRTTLDRRVVAPTFRSD